MRVQLKDTITLQTNLALGQRYFVYEIEYTPSGNTYYRIENDAKQVVPYDSALFNVVSDKLYGDWTDLNKPNQSSVKVPEDVAYITFWEEFYNDDPKALRAFRKVKARLYLEELEESEIRDILESNNEDEIYFVLNTLISVKRDTFTNEIIQLSQTKLVENNYPEDDVLTASFQYLSLFQEEHINEFFIHYLTNIELGNDKLTEIVNDYFAS
ncbi:hypothetical protein [Paenibacillus sp. MER 99-2]|uniref:hypothetical protein n=1 Tax=Paenibacillus sp. MER 99-2 TaxID=2939572 RepID=UPI00203C02A5|nr:hypothetical protein [Paenibacillus sp. MER 99-2]MCM3174232.1 hypothetical protein [Paenibacillus sp. MER 99-2]